MGTNRKSKEKFTMKRIMGVDYGDARTGIAVSDLLCSLVGTTTVIHSRNMEKTITQICAMVKDSDVGEIVVGLPKNMDGTEGVRAELCREFAQKLGEATGLPVTMWDERRTTVEAHNILSQHNYHGKKRKDTVDAVAASLILEGYLAFRGR
jgi:putative Holliday junction resolvase